MSKEYGIGISSILQNAFKLFKSQLNYVCAGPCDGTVLKMHYRWAFFFTLGGFMTVWHGWYFNQVIHCVTGFNGEKETRSDYKNICLSYPFIEVKDNPKRFLLFYRWIHWSLLFIAFLYYIPRKVLKSIENPKAKKILEDLATLASRYDQSEKDAAQRASYYMITNLRTLNSIYFKYLGLHILALLIDIFVLLFLDFLLQNRFVMLIPNSFPFDRDPETFSDFLSQTFPPFVSCYLNEKHKIIPGRKDAIGCHLLQMEMYEKFFILFWFFLYTVMIVSIMYITFLLFMLVPKFRKYYLLNSKPIHAIKSVSVIGENIIDKLKVGDIYMLYRLKQHLSPGKFYELLLKIGDPQIKRFTSHSPKDNKREMKPNCNRDNDIEFNIRNRHTNEYDTPDSSNKKNILNQLLHDNHKLIANYPNLMKINEVTDKSILIES